MSEVIQQPQADNPTKLSDVAQKPARPVLHPQVIVMTSGAYRGVYPAEMAQDMYVEYCAASGKVVDEEGGWRKLPVSAFAIQLGVDRTTLYYWQKNLPDFWGRVNKRRRELAGGARTQAVWDSVYMAARAGKPEAQKIWLTNHDENYIAPTETRQHELGPGLAGLFNAARQTQHRKQLDADNANNS